MKDLIAKFRAFSTAHKAFFIALLSMLGIGGGDYMLNVRPSAMRANAVNLPVRHAPGEKPTFGATGDNGEGIFIDATAHSLDLNSKKITHQANGTASTDGAAFGQIAATTLNSFASPVASVNMGSQKLISMADGTASSDGAVFHQIGDAVLAGKAAACDALTTANQGTLSGTAQTIDGVALSTAGMRACVFGQSTVAQDGCYVVASGAWTRCTDLPSGANASNRTFITVAGSANKGVWTIQVGANVVGTNDLVVVNQASGGGGISNPLTADLSFGTTHRGTNAADPIAGSDLATRNYVDFLSSIFLFGDGSDGPLSISSGTTTLARDTYYSDVTISGTAKIATNGFRLFVSGTLNLDNAPADAITRSGGAGGVGAAGGTGGSLGASGGAVVAGNSVGGGTAGTAGGAGGTAAGSQATASLANGFIIGGDSNTSGLGGSGSGGGGGTARGGSVGTQRQLNRHASAAAWYGISSASVPTAFQGGNGGPGGGGGGGDGTAGAGGGGGGGGGAPIEIYARTVSRGGSTAAGAISSKGGDGGNGGTAAAGNRGGGAGGAGGGGGGIHMVVGFLTGTSASNVLDVSGGKGGDAGNGTGSGTGGSGATGGNSGAAVLYVLSTGTITANAPNAAGTSGNAASGNTGGTGGAGASARVSL